MASRSRKSGGNTANKFLWFLLVGGLIFAFFQIPYDPGVKGVVGIAQSKAETVKNWATNVGPNISGFVEDILKGGSSPQTPSTNPDGYTPYEPNKPGNGQTPQDVQNSLNGIPIKEADNVSYNRDDWNHWIDVRSCWTVREAVLARDATPGSLAMKDKNGNDTTDVNNACEITSGKWSDPYSGKEFTNPKDLDIDHMVPLNYTAQHGGNSWDKNRKEQYANNLDPGHLLAVSASENRSKSDKGPGSWKPSNQAYYCQYATNWVTVSTKWGLTISNNDAEAIKQMLSTCQ